ncbi:MAG: ABC transporter permease [Bacillota bacterium]|nr:ABC transporter permease [Bacillota bacterium]
MTNRVKLVKYSYGLFGIILFLLIWETFPRLGIVDSTFLPPFSKVAVALGKLITSGKLFAHLFKSLQRSLIGFGLAIAISVPLGLVIGWFSRVERLLDPLLQTFRQTSALALFPVFILIFGIGEVSKVAIIFWGAKWPLLLSTISGVKNVDPLLIKAARSMGAKPFTLFRKVILPGAFPSIFTGMRLSATSSILILIAAEMIGASSGLGFLIYWSESSFEIPTMYAAIITIAFLGLVINYALIGFGKYVMRWQQTSVTGD